MRKKRRASDDTFAGRGTDQRVAPVVERRGVQLLPTLSPALPRDESEAVLEGDSRAEASHTDGDRTRGVGHARLVRVGRTPRSPRIRRSMDERARRTALSAVRGSPQVRTNDDGRTRRPLRYGLYGRPKRPPRRNPRDGRRPLRSSVRGRRERTSVGGRPRFSVMCPRSFLLRDDRRNRTRRQGVPWRGKI